MRDLDEITGEIVDAAFHIHTELGPGLLESVYETVLAKRLEQRGFIVERQKPITFEFDGMRFEEGFRLDLLVDARVVVEIKSVERLAGSTQNNFSPISNSSICQWVYSSISARLLSRKA